MPSRRSTAMGWTLLRSQVRGSGWAALQSHALGHPHRWGRQPEGKCNKCEGTEGQPRKLGASSWRASWGRWLEPVTPSNSRNEPGAVWSGFQGVGAEPVVEGGGRGYQGWKSWYVKCMAGRGG